MGQLIRDSGVGTIWRWDSWDITLDCNTYPNLGQLMSMGQFKFKFKLSQSKTYLVMEGADLGLRIYLISKLRKLSKCSMSRLFEAVILENNFSWLPHASCKQVTVYWFSDKEQKSDKKHYTDLETLLKKGKKIVYTSNKVKLWYKSLLK